MVNRMIFWTGFAIATRALGLAIQMRPLLNKSTAWPYPIYMAVGCSFGYWMENIDAKQTAILEARRQILLQKRERKAERDAQNALEEA